MDNHDIARQPAGIPTGGEFAAHDRADAGVSLERTRTVATPARDFEVLQRPLTIEEAAELVDDESGYVSGIVEVRADEYFGAGLDYDAFYDGLTDKLIAGVQPVGTSATIRGVSDDGQTLYVEVGTDFAEWQSGDYS